VPRIELGVTTGLLVQSLYDERHGMRRERPIRDLVVAVEGLSIEPVELPETSCQCFRAFTGPRSP